MLARPLIAIAPAWGVALGARLLDRTGKAVRTAPRDALLRDELFRLRFDAPSEVLARLGLHEFRKLGLAAELRERGFDDQFAQMIERHGELFLTRVYTPYEISYCAARKAATATKYVYFFGGGKADGNRSMKDVLGGKGAGLAEMTNAGLPVPPGFTISTGACDVYYKNKATLPPGESSLVSFDNSRARRLWLISRMVRVVERNSLSQADTLARWAASRSSRSRLAWYAGSSS